MARTKQGLGQRLGNAAYHVLSGRPLPQQASSRLTKADLKSQGRVPKTLRSAPRGAQASVAISDPYRDPTLDEIGGQRIAQPGRVFQRWAYPFRGYSQPILEIPTNRIQRYMLCLDYFVTEDLVNASLNMKVEFALANHEIHVEVESDTIPVWMPLDEIPDQSDVPEPSRTPNRVFIAQHLKDKLEDLKEKLDLDRWNQNYWLESAIYGDAFANIVDGVENRDEDDMDEDFAPALQTLATIAKKRGATAADKMRYATALKQRTKLAQARKAKAELKGVLDEMRAVEEQYKGIYAQAFKEGRLLEDASTKKAKRGDDLIVVQAGAVQVHVGPNLLKKAEKLTEKFDITAEEAFKKLNALAKKRDSLLKANMQTLGGNYTIDCIQTLNPSAVWETRNDVGEVVRMELVKRIGVDASPLVIDDQIHVRWSGSDYTTYGISDLFPAFRAIKLKRSLEEALAAYAERYSQPIIVCKVGESDSEQMYAALDILMSDAADLFKNYDRRSVLIVPWHYQIEIVGTEGKPLRLDMYLNYAVERMLTALGVPKTFLWGDGSNYATARTQFQSLVTRLKSLQFKSNRMLSSRVYGRFLERRGYKDGDGGKIHVECTFENNDLDSEETVAKLMSSMAAVSNATGNPLMMSETTLLEMLGKDIDIEHQNKLREAAKLMKLKSIAPEQAPAQDPQKQGAGEGTDPALNQQPVSELNGTPADPTPGQIPNTLPPTIPNSLYAEDKELARTLAKLSADLDKAAKIKAARAKRAGVEEISMAEAVKRMAEAQARAKAQVRVAPLSKPVK